MLSEFALPILAMPRPAKRVIVLAVDASLCILSVWLAYYLRLGEWVKLSGDSYWQPMWAVGVSLAVALPIFIVNGFYRAIFRYSGYSALITVMKAIGVYGLLFATVFTAVGIDGVPRTVGLIQPMLLDIVRILKKHDKRNGDQYDLVLKRAQRYAAIQERLISPEGTFPPIGRSLDYRFGAFQLLSQIALIHQLPDGVSPAQVRSGLTAVIRRMMEANGTFDANGWLTLGFCGHQPEMAEYYLSTGSMYLCSVGLLPLGLPPEDEFWSAPPEDWTAKKIWAGKDMPNDNAI